MRNPEPRKILRAVSIVAFGTVLGFAAIVLGLAISRDLMSAKPSGVRDHTLDVGDRLTIPGVDFSRSDLSLVVATLPTCPACRASGNFYKALFAFADSKKIPAYLLQSGHDQGPNFNNAFIDEAHSVDVKPSSVGIFAVPTVAVIDRDARVKSVHIGIVEPGTEQPMIAALVGGASDVTLPISNASEREVALWRRMGRSVQVLDVRNPGQHPEIARIEGALEVPVGDLDIRARYELDRGKIVAIDCRPVGRLNCQGALVTLRQRNFQHIVGISYAEPGWLWKYSHSAVALFTKKP